MRRLIVILCAFALLAEACGREPDTLFAPEAGTIVVDAFLVVGQPIHDIVLSQTLAANAPYSLEEAGLPGASVRIIGGGHDVLFRDVIGAPGTYAPSIGVVVQPDTDYRLEVSAADGRRVTASTRTPKRFTISEWVLLDDLGNAVLGQLSTFEQYGDSLFARPENQLVYSYGLLEGRFDPADIIGIQVGLFSRTPDSPRVIDPEFVDEEDLDSLPRTNSSPPLDASTGTVRLPWFAIFFEGKYVFKVWSMDRNWFDLARTDPVLRGGGFGFGGQAGDGFERPIFHLDGGIGLFGSGAVDSVGVLIHPRPAAARGTHEDRPLSDGLPATNR